MSSVESQLRAYARHLDDAYADVELDELTRPGVPIIDGRVPTVPPVSVPRWLIAVAAAAIALVLLGGLSWLLDGFANSEPVGPPESLIEREFGPVPAFTATYAVGEATVEVSYDGTGYRFIVIEGRPELGNATASGVPSGVCEGGTVVWDGSRLAVLEGCEADEPGFAVRPTTQGFDPLAHLAWQSVGWWAGEGGWRDYCASVAHNEQPAEPIAGRAATKIRCTGAVDDLELWVDVESGLVLKLAGSDGGPAWPSDFEMIDIDEGPVFDSDTFAIAEQTSGEPQPPGQPEVPAGPVSDEPIEYPVEPFGLSAGETVAPFTGALLGGGTFDLETTRGRPVLVMLWADWCPPCSEDLAPFQELADRWSDRVTFVSVLSADSTPEAAAELVAAAGLTVPVVVDETDNLWRAREAIPKYLLIGSDGTALAGWTGMSGPGLLEQMLEQEFG